MVWRVRTGQLPVPAQPLSLETQVKPEAAGARRGGAGLTRAGQGRRPVKHWACTRSEVMFGRSGYRALPLGDFDRFQQSSFGFLGSQKGCLSPEPGGVGPGAGEWLPGPQRDWPVPPDLSSLPIGGGSMKGIGCGEGVRPGVGMLLLCPL